MGIRTSEGTKREREGEAEGTGEERGSQREGEGVGWKRDGDLETRRIESAGGEGEVSSLMALALEKEGFPGTQWFSALGTHWNHPEIFQHVPRLGLSSQITASMTPGWAWVLELLNIPQ